MKVLKKINNEIDRLEQQKAGIESRLSDLYKQRTQLENTEMIDAIRDAQFKAEDILSVIQAIKKGGNNIQELIALAENATLTNTTNEEENNHETEEQNS